MNQLILKLGNHSKTVNIPKMNSAEDLARLI